jgi:RimJ/RimL family protein N-acetyltransferase
MSRAVVMISPLSCVIDSCGWNRSGKLEWTCEYDHKYACYLCEELLGVPSNMVVSGWKTRGKECWNVQNTEDAVLRRWTPNDADALLRAETVSDDLRIQIGQQNLSTLEACRKHIENQLGVESASACHFAVAVDGVAVGDIGISSMEFDHGTAWVSYWLSAEFRGRGLIARGLATASEWAFSEGLFRLELGHRVNNPASCRVATRAGFQAEGIERGKLRYGLDRYDVETHARLASDPRPEDITPLPC